MSSVIEHVTIAVTDPPPFTGLDTLPSLGVVLLSPGRAAVHAVDSLL